MKQKLIVIVGAVLLMLCIGAGSAMAEGNETNLTNETNHYQEDLDYWYDYYTNDRTSGYESKLRNELESLLNSDTLSSEDRNEAILIKLGWDFRLENYMDESKRNINYDTGEVTYSLGIGNWWKNLFNSGIDESKLPQTKAEGDALYKIYNENYEEWIKILKGEIE